MKPRIEPLSDEELTPEQAEQLAPTRQRGRVLNIFRTLVHYPKLMKRWTVFANHVLFKSSLPSRDREILILRIGWRCASEYEWGQHVEIGKASGLSDDEILGIASGSLADPFENALLRAADELRDAACLSDETWATLAERYSKQQLMDVVFTVGQYQLVSMALNTFGVQLDEGIGGFEATVGRRP